MRKLSETRRKVQPLREPGPQPWDAHDDSSGPATRETSPYKVGDVVKFKDGEQIKDALIIQVRSKLQEQRGRWIPNYVVRARNKDGSWSQLWRSIFPGDIERGFGTWDVR
jgi:hypothetical protein